MNQNALASKRMSNKSILELILQLHMTFITQQTGRRLNACIASLKNMLHFEIFLHLELSSFTFNIFIVNELE